MPEFANAYTISPSEDSTVAVEVLRSGLLGGKKRHLLFFPNFSGEMYCAGNDFVDSRIVLTVDASTVICRDAWMSEKKRQAIAHDVTVIVSPTIGFTSTSVRAKALRGFVITGVLQIRGTSRELKINMSISPARTNGFQLDGDATFKLTDFHLPRPSKLFGLIGTKDEVVLHTRLWAVPAVRMSERS